MVHCFGDPGLGGESTCTYRAIKQTVGLWEDRPQMFGGDADRPVLEPGELLAITEDWLRMYVVFPSNEAADTFTLFVAATHAADAFDTAPYIWISSADVDSGKSRLAS